MKAVFPSGNTAFFVRLRFGFRCLFGRFSERTQGFIEGRTQSVLGCEIVNENSPATLVAIIVAARRAGDRELERHCRRELLEGFGVRLSFSRPTERREDQQK